jgi:hypothetical protein
MLAETVAMGIAKVLAGQFLDSLQLHQGVRKALQVPVDQLFGRAERAGSRKTIERLAQGVAAELVSFPGALEDNAGAARAAADTFLDALRLSALSATKLIELDLDPARIEQHILSAGSDHLRGASAERRGHVERAAAELAALLVANAPALPGVQVAFMQAMLRKRSTE